MTRLDGATIKQFIDTVEEMRTVYPFEDDKAKIVSTYDFPTDSHSRLELYVMDERTGVHITMQKDIRMENEK